ncbi:MAG: cytidylate kinase [Nitrospirae bacterium RBG_16_64_22]|nr:MAG: cytidylate kinase [Nitrospirae bacterium RBG_16_64_22]
MRTAPIVAVDGPAGAGKSTVARRLAARLGFTYVDSGAMYRTVGLAARRRGLDPEDEAAMNRLMEGLGRLVLRTEGERTRVWLDSEEVSNEIRTPEAGEWASRVSRSQAVREGLKGFQRRMGEAGGVVMEGRDIGTVIFPDAEFKFFLTASLEVRGGRRHAEWAFKGGAAPLEKTIEEIEKRDYNDRSRHLAPLTVPADAITVDTSDLTVDEVVDLLSRRIEAGPSGARAE